VIIVCDNDQISSQALQKVG